MRGEVMENVSDARLIQRYIQGDTDALDLLIRKYQHLVYGLVLSYIGDFEEAKDVAQEVFMTAYLHLGELKQPSRFGSWLKRIARNLCINHLRARDVEQAALEELRRLGDQLPSVEVSLEVQAEQVMEAIGRLSLNHRQVILMHYIDGLSSQDIGDFLGITPGAVDQRLHRAREALKEHLMTVVEHVLKRHKLDETFLQEAVRKKLRHAREARARYAFSEAIRSSNEALEMLDEVDSDVAHTSLKVSVLEERGAASRFLYGAGRQKSLMDWKEAMEIKKDTGDLRSYASSLIDMGGVYVSKGDLEGALRHYEEAARLFEELGDQSGVGRALYWTGVGYLLAFLEKGEGKVETALDYFERSLKVARKAGDMEQMCLSLVAVESLNQINTGMDWASVRAYGTARFDLKRTTSWLTWRGQPGFQWFEEGRSTQSRLSSAWAYMRWPSRLLKMPPCVQDRWMGPAFACGHEQMTATSTVEGIGEAIDVQAGRFEGCVKVSTVFERSGQEENEFYRSVNAHIAGIRTIWFAPGAGPVMVVYAHQDGATTCAELVEMDIRRRSSAYFPLRVGNRWRYEVRNDHTDKVVYDSYRVVAQEAGLYYIAEFEYVTCAETT